MAIITADEYRRRNAQDLASLPPPLQDKAICERCPHPTDCRGVPCLNDRARPSLEVGAFSQWLLPSQARAIEEGLRNGLTFRRMTNGGTYGDTLVCSNKKLKKHLATYPRWGEEMQRLNDVNVLKVDKGSGRRRKGDLCSNGHSIAEHGRREVRSDGTSYLRCQACKREQMKRGVIPSMEKVGLAMAMMMQRKPISSYIGSRTDGYIMSHGNFMRCRREFPQFERLAAETIAWCRAHPRQNPNCRTNKSKKLPQRGRRKIGLREPALTGRIAGPAHPIFDAVLAAVPFDINHERRMEVIATLALAVVEGEIRIEDVKAKVPEFVRSFNRTYPTKYGPRSLDAPAFHDSPVPLIETIADTQGLWA